MILVDANVLLYAVNSDAHHHDRARTFLDDALSGGRTVGFAWIALLTFVRLATKESLLPSPLTIDEAMDRVDAWDQRTRCSDLLGRCGPRSASPRAAH